MKFYLRILLLLFLVSGTLTQDDFDLFDALPDPAPTPGKPKQATTKKPTQQGGGNDGFDLGDAVKPDVPKPETPKKPNSGDSGNDGFDLGDAVKPDPNAKPDKPAVKPPSSGGGGGTFDDSDLFGASEGDYKPDGGRSGGRAMDPQGGADQSQETGSGPIAGIISAVGVALVGAASSYFAYQKKKLCFKLQGGADPESGKGHQGTHSEPQTFSSLLQSS